MLQYFRSLMQILFDSWSMVVVERLLPKPDIRSSNPAIGNFISVFNIYSIKKTRIKKNRSIDFLKDQRIKTQIGLSTNRSHTSPYLCFFLIFEHIILNQHSPVLNQTTYSINIKDQHKTLLPFLSNQ